MPFPFRLISEQRSLLMGWAILFIMLSHAFSPSWANIPFLHTIAGKGFALNDVGGFLFLSGFGLYYSFQRNGHILSFYKKRISRLYIPFLIVALPFYIISLLIGEIDLIKFVLSETGLFFFVYGNNGMWYISLSLLLYLIFPLIYYILFKRGYVTANTIVVLVLSILFIFFFRLYLPAYYRLVAIGLVKIPLFIVGIYTGYLAVNEKVLSRIGGGGLVACVILLWVLSKHFPQLEFLYKDSIVLVGIPCIAFFFHLCSKNVQPVCKVFEWLGSYSLELYMLHMLLKNATFSILDFYGMTSVDERIVVAGILLASLLLCNPVHIFTRKIAGGIL